MINKCQLANISLIEFSRRIYNSGGISLKGLLLIPIYYIQMLFGLPFAFIQHLLFHKQIQNTQVLIDPIFILGHYRSGTTYLHKLIASDKRFGCLTNYDALFANSNLLLGPKLQILLQRIIYLFRIKNPFFHNSIVKLSEPAEEDDYMMNKASAYSAYWGLIFPRRWIDWLNEKQLSEDEIYANCWKREYFRTIQYTTFKNNGKQIILKSPPNTGRIRILLELFPQSKFIFIYRNPYHLYLSIHNMWKSAILKFYSVQKLTENEQEEIVFSHFDHLLSQYEQEKHQIPDNHLIEISYEELMANPQTTIEKIYSKLNLPNFKNTIKDLIYQINIEKNYQPLNHQLDLNTKSKIERRWGEYIKRWGYDTETEKCNLSNPLYNCFCEIKD